MSSTAGTFVLRLNWTNTVVSFGFFPLWWCRCREKWEWGRGRVGGLCKSKGILYCVCVTPLLSFYRGRPHGTWGAVWNCRCIRGHSSKTVTAAIWSHHFFNGQHSWMYICRGKGYYNRVWRRSFWAAAGSTLAVGTAVGDAFWWRRHACEVTILHDAGNTVTGISRCSPLIVEAAV